MALTVAAALKAKIESLGLGLAAYRDEPPPGTEPPYVTLHERLNLTLDESGDNGANPTGREEVQVDLWQDWRNADKSLAEDVSLIEGLTNGLHGASLVNVGTKRVYGCKVTLSVRQVEKENNLIHDALSVELARRI